jgi:hypothetical protein
MDSADLAKRWWLLDTIERNVRSSAGWVGENDPTVFGRVPWNVAQRRLPEREHFLETSAADDDRADPDTAPRPACGRGVHPTILTARSRYLRVIPEHWLRRASRLVDPKAAWGEGTLAQVGNVCETRRDGVLLSMKVGS